MSVTRNQYATIARYIEKHFPNEFQESVKELQRPDFPTKDEISKLHSISKFYGKDSKFVFVMSVIVIYDHKAINLDCNMRKGLRDMMSKELEICGTGVSNTLASAKVRYKLIPGFKEKVSQAINRFKNY